MRRWKVGILGGGPGGLMTAYLLQKHSTVDVSVTIFEASNRLGGKIQSKRFQKLPVSYEAGAAELYDYSNTDADPLKELITELGLPLHRMEGCSVIMENVRISNCDDMRESLGISAAQALSEFDRSARDRITPHEFYMADMADMTNAADTSQAEEKFSDVLKQILEPRARCYIENLIHSDLATEPDKTNTSYGLQNYLMNHDAYLRLYTIEGGLERLPRELARRIRATIHLEQPAVSIEKEGKELLRVTSVGKNTIQTEDFDFVIAALPHNHLASLECRGSRLAEAMARHRNHYEYPAHYLRVSILFDRPFWRERVEESFLMLDAFGGCCLYDESSRDPGETHGVLGWLIGGECAKEMSLMEDEELIARVRQSLPRVLGSNGDNYFLEGSVHRWTNAVNGMPGGKQQKNLDRRHQIEPIDHPNFFVVGDYLFDSTLNGVLDSAEYVVGWLTARMSDVDGGSV